MLNFFRKQVDDNEIIAHIRAGNPAKSEHMDFLYANNKKPVFKYVRTNGGTQEEAEDVLQEGLIILLEQIMDGKFLGRSKISSYLYVVCRNLFIAQRKRDKKIVALPEDHDETETPNPATDPLRFMEAEDLGSQVRTMLNEIDEKCRKLLIWSDGEGRPMKWIAESLDYSVQAAMNKKTKCKKAVREKVRKNPGYARLVSEVLAFDSAIIQKEGVWN